MKPLIGLSCYQTAARWGVWDRDAAVLPTAYAASIEAAGGIAILLPPPAIDPAADAVAVVARLDALVITGGPDVDPARYGQQPASETDRPDELRDTWELALLDAADAMSLPVLGICRGLQVMTVQRGGRLIQHLPGRLGHTGHSPGGAQFGEITVDTEPGSRLAGLVGPSLQVSCHHHQAVDTFDGSVVSARSADKVIEAVERPGARFDLAVQWHPEERDDTGLFGGLVRAAADAGRSPRAAR